MPSSDYANAVGGGLKLKGAKDAGVKKNKKKKAKEHGNTDDKSEAATTAPAEDTRKEDRGDDASPDSAMIQGRESTTIEKSDHKVSKAEATSYGKTEAQRRHEERRRKMLEEKLQKEGSKTHKERVEELNKYLSGLSEHHDMPRIGPG